MAEMQKSLTRNEMIARMMIPRRMPILIKRPIEEITVENEAEDVRENINQMNGELIDDFKMMDNLA